MPLVFATIESNRFRLRKANGLVKDVFEARHMQRLQGEVGIGHVRYPTAGSSSASEAQPFYVNSPFGITLAHNGNLTNAHEVRQKLFEKDRRHINTTSDSEVLLNVLAHEIDTVKGNVTSEDVFRAVTNVHRTIRGAYAVTAMIIGHGMIAFRDPHGIRPLCLGKRDVNGRTECIWWRQNLSRWMLLASILFATLRLVRQFTRHLTVSYTLSSVQTTLS